MLKIGTETRLTPEEATKRAVEFFGPAGYGLKLVEATPTSACLREPAVELKLLPVPKEKGPLLT